MSTTLKAYGTETNDMLTNLLLASVLSHTNIYIYFFKYLFFLLWIVRKWENGRKHQIFMLEPENIWHFTKSSFLGFLFGGRSQSAISNSS